MADKFIRDPQAVANLTAVVSNQLDDLHTLIQDVHQDSLHNLLALQGGPAIAEVTLAFRHLEDAETRLQKALACIEDLEVGEA